MRYVNELSGQITGFGSFQRSVGLAFSGAVSGDKIFQNSQAFFVAGTNGKINDFAGRVDHQAFHAGHLPQLIKRASGAGSDHGVNRSHFIHRFRNQILNFILRSLPNFYDFVVSFRVGQEALLILAFLISRACFSASRQNFSFLFRQFEVVITPAYAGNRRLLESEFFYPVQNIRRGVNAVFFNQPRDERRQNFFAGFFVDVRKIIRQSAVEHKPADGRFKDFSVENFIFRQIVRQNFYFSPYVRFVETVGQNRVIGRGVKFPSPWADCLILVSQ